MEIPTETFDIFENNENVIYLFLLGIIVLVYFFYLYFYSEKLLEKMEKDLIEMKENIAFYTNKLLLYFNMEGNSIRTTKKTSF